MAIVQFKSTPEFFEKEKSGAKNNTIRKIIPNDLRIRLLRAGHRRIIIVNTATLESFERYITDYSEWEGFAIISWRA